MSTSPSPLTGMAEYNISWMDKTFSSRKSTELLLAPELENGNLTRADYDRILAALPGPQYSQFLGFGTSAAGTVLYSRFRPPKAHIGLIGYIVGDVLGKGFRILTHRRCFRSIENINGFSRAMDNVKRKVGYSPGLIGITRPLAFGDLGGGEEIPFQKEVDTPYGVDSPVSAGSPPQTAAVANAKPTERPPAVTRSRWDEIRAARQGDGQTKSWDYIRQGRRPDGTPMRKPPPARTSQSQNGLNGGESWPSPFREEDRAAAQASFDAMLEKERSMSTSSKERSAVW